jgi:NADPH-dependent glutamate synthase beta subunit-like oxidoreductase
VLGINADPVTIKQIEWEIISKGWRDGWIRPVKPVRRTGRSAAVVGSGPAGLAAAQQLNRAGHTVTLFEKNERVGGLLRYGIPEFKLEKWTVDRRLEQMREEGVSFQTGVDVGADLSAQELRSSFDAVLLCTGSEQPRDLPIEGRNLDGVHFAMDFLSQQNRRDHGDRVDPSVEILATDKDVVILGGGDTGSDCVGTSHRQGARTVTSVELLERPPDERSSSTPWPVWPLMFRTSSSHEEGGEREYAVLTRRFEGEGGRVKRLHAARVRFGEHDESGRPRMEEIPGSEFTLPADLVLLAMGFVHPVHRGLVSGKVARRPAPWIATCSALRACRAATPTSERRCDGRRAGCPRRSGSGAAAGLGPAPGGIASPRRRRSRRIPLATLDAFPPSPVRFHPDGGALIPGDDRDVYDLERLERVITDLVSAYRQAQDESATLRRRVEEKTRRIRTLEGQLLEANQKRQDVAKRIDELISQLDHLDAQLGGAEV